MDLADFLNEQLSLQVTKESLEFLKETPLQPMKIDYDLDSAEIYDKLIDKIPYRFHKFFRTLTLEGFISFLHKLKSKRVEK